MTMHQKMIVLLYIYAQKGKFWNFEIKNEFWPLSLFLSSFISLKESIQIWLWQHFFAMGPWLFLLEHLFCLSHRKICWIMSMDNVGLKICLLGTSSSMIILTFFLGVNQSGPRLSSTTNYKSYMALGWLRGPWCKDPLRDSHVYLSLIRLMSSTLCCISKSMMKCNHKKTISKINFPLI